MKFGQVLEKLKQPSMRARLPEWNTTYWFWFPLLDSVMEMKNESEIKKISPWKEVTMRDIMREDWEVYHCEMSGPSVFGFDIANGLMEKGYKVRRAHWEEGLYLKKGLRSNDTRAYYILFVGERQEGFLMRPDDVMAVDWMMIRE